jgi:hypothetical protein
LNAAIDACATQGVAAESVFIHTSLRAGLIEFQRTNTVDLTNAVDGLVTTEGEPATAPTKARSRKNRVP